MADTAERALRRFCLECQGDDPEAVRACADAACLLYAARPYQSAREASPHEAPLRAIRRFCLTCAGDRREARACDAKNCPLWSFRFGVRPATFKRVAARREKSRRRLSLPGL